MKWFGRRTEIRSFNEDIVDLGEIGRSSKGTRPVAVAQIVGSVGRAHELKPNFMPVVNPHGSFRFRQIKAMMEEGENLPPIDVYKLGDRYYVLDGHHRVAAARRIGQLAIDAVITEFRPVSDGAGMMSAA